MGFRMTSNVLLGVVVSDYRNTITNINSLKVGKSLKMPEITRKQAV